MDEQQIATNDRGLLGVAANSMAVVGEKGVTGSFGLLRDARSEMSQRTLAFIDWVGSLQQSSTRLARSAAQRADEFAVICVDSGEQIGLTFVRAICSTGSNAAQLASRTAASLTSTRGDGITRA